jgi:hypothetical protein
MRGAGRGSTPETSSSFEVAWSGGRNDGRVVEPAKEGVERVSLSGSPM